MPAEHLNEKGQLCQGYFCSYCGKATGMSSHMNQACKPNPELVKKLTQINESGSIEEYTFRKLRGDYDD